MADITEVNSYDPVPVIETINNSLETLERLILKIFCKYIDSKAER